MMVQNARLMTVPKEALSYTVPAAPSAPATLAPARLTSYVFAHSKYSVGLGQGNLLSTLLSGDADTAESGAPRSSVAPAASRDVQTAP
jgi:hypothetical protein